MAIQLTWYFDDMVTQEAIPESELIDYLKETGLLVEFLEGIAQFNLEAPMIWSRPAHGIGVGIRLIVQAEKGERYADYTPLLG